MSQLSKKIDNLRLPVRYPDQIRSMENNYLRMIVFNHRPNLEKTFPEFTKAMSKLWKRRQDFRVWIPYYPKKEKNTNGYSPRSQSPIWTNTITG